MKHKYWLPVLAGLGFVVAIVAVVLGNSLQPTQPATPLPTLPIPYKSYVAGSGVIEARRENVPIGTPVAGIVTTIFVRWGDQVIAGQPLFRIDDRALRAQRLPAEASVQEAAAKLNRASSLLRIAEGVPDKRAVSVEEISKRKANVAVAQATLLAAQAQVRRIDAELDMHTVRALEGGIVLQIGIHPGQYASVGSQLMLLGDDTDLHVRVDIDQNDAWRVRPDAPAIAFLRGNPAISMPLRFVRIEPIVIPRASLTGDSTQRVDTRVLQVIFRFEPAGLPVYVGQLVDVYIGVPPSHAVRNRVPTS